jgi:magnesium transporter
VERVVVYVETPDRPGVLGAASRAIAEAGGNIVASVAFVDDGVGRILMVAEYPGSADDLAERVRGDLGGEARVEAAPRGAAAAHIIAEALSARPEVAPALEPFLGAADILDAIMRMGGGEARRVVSSLPPATLARLLSEAEGEALEAIVGWAGEARVARALRELSPEDAGEVLRKMPRDAARRILGMLPRDVASRALAGLEYPPGTAGAIMSTSLPRVPAGSKVSDALSELGRPGYEVRDTVAVVDGEGRLVGLAEAGDLLSLSPGAPVEAAARIPPVSASPEDDAEELARAMIRYRVRRAPVVDGEGRLLGVVTLEDVARLVAEESAEDIAKVAGSWEAVERYVPARVADLVRARLPWLLAVFIVEALAAAVIKRYEGVISGAAVLAAFLPLVMAAGGSAGTQAVGIVLRSLALGEVSERRLEDLALVARKEAVVAAALAALLSGLALALSYAVSGSLWVSTLVAATVAASVILADVVGALLPLAARRLGLDPASVSTPLVTTLVDVGVSALYLAAAAPILAYA